MLDWNLAFHMWPELTCLALLTFVFLENNFFVPKALSVSSFYLVVVSLLWPFTASAISLLFFLGKASWYLLVRTALLIQPFLHLGHCK